MVRPMTGQQGSQRGSGTPRPPLVIISGLGAPRAGAIAYGRYFQKRDHRVFTVPQRLLGYGDIRIAAGMVGGEIDRVRAITGATKVNLVGMSLGGLIGLYYLKVAGGAPHVERFISVGGPLSGSSLARVAQLVPIDFVHSIAQTAPDSALMREVAAAPVPAGVRMISLGTRGDFLTPGPSRAAEGFEPVETPYGVCPVGHWMLFLDPRNQRAVAELLEGP